MNNVEYKKIAAQVLNNEYDYAFFNKEFAVTNISEFFLLKIREVLLQNGKKNNSYTIAKELNLICHISSSKEEEKDMESKNDITPYTNFNSISTSDLESTIDQTRIIRFLYIQSFLKDFPNATDILQGIGIEHSEELLLKVNSIKDIRTDEDKKIVCHIIEDFEKLNNTSSVFFFFLSVYYNLRISLLNFLKLDSCDKFILSILNNTKRIVEKYHDVYVNRLKKYFFIKEHWDEYLDEHLEAIIRIVTRAMEKFIQDDEFNKLKSWKIDDENEIDALPFSAALILDLFFMLHFVTYENPFWLKLGFYLTSENAPYHLRTGMIDSLQDNKFSPIIQYEYECFCKHSAEHSILLQFYSGAPVNLDSLNIEYYKLDQWNTDINSLLLGRYKPQPILQEEKTAVSPKIETIVHDLEPNLKVFEQRSKKGRGYTFKRDYLTNLITLSEKISGSLAVHGFAYIIYKSQFFNWGIIEFDNSFVEKIANIFNITHKLGTKYPLNKCKKKAEAMLEKESLQGLWNKNI